MGITYDTIQRKRVSGYLLYKTKAALLFSKKPSI